MFNKIMAGFIVAITVLATVVLFPGKSNAFDVPFDWSCNAAGTSCRAPGLQPRLTKFPPAFHKKYNYPHVIEIERPEDYKEITTGWTSRGDCNKLLGATEFHDVDVAKAKYCLFRQKGYAAPIPTFKKTY